MQKEPRNRDLLLQLIGKRMKKLYLRQYNVFSRLFIRTNIKSVVLGTLYYYNPNMVYGIKMFKNDIKLRDLSDEYFKAYSSVKDRLNLSLLAYNRT